MAEGTWALTAYCVSSIAMTIANKYVLSGRKFGMNLLVLAAQSGVCVVGLAVCRALGLLRYRPLNVADARAWLPVSLLLVAMIYTGSKSLQHLTVAMFTVFKNVTIPCVALGERAVFGKRITPLMWTAFAMIISSSIIGGANDLGFNARGYGWMSANVVVSATYLLAMRRAIAAVGFSDFDSVYYNNALALPVMLLLSLVVEDWAGMLGRGAHSDADAFPFAGLVASSASAFAISYSTAWCARVVSATTYSMAGALNKLPVAVSGLLFFASERHTVGWGSAASILCAFAAGVVYSVAQTRERQRVKNDTPPLSALATPEHADESALLMRSVRA